MGFTNIDNLEARIDNGRLTFSFHLELVILPPAIFRVGDVGTLISFIDDFVLIVKLT